MRFPPAGLRSLPEKHFWVISRTRLYVIIEIFKDRKKKEPKRLSVVIMMPDDYENLKLRNLAGQRAYLDAFGIETETGVFGRDKEC